MAFAKVSKSAEDLKQGGGSKYINNSGMYPVRILAPIVSNGKGGSTAVDMYVDYEGQPQVIYGNLRVTNNDGKTNEIGSKIFNQLLIIAGLDDVADPEENDLPVGKKESMKTVMILEDLCDVDVVMRVQMEYGMFNGNITEKKVIKGFYRAGDMASAEEIVNETEAGVQYAKDLGYASNVAYKDDTDEAMITAWIAAKRPKGTGSNATAATPTPSFGKKRSFGKA